MYRNIGDEYWFEYHCWEDPNSADAELWYRSHQRVKILDISEMGGGDSKLERLENGEPAVYKIEFEDGFVGHAFEDEILDSDSEFDRPNPVKKNNIYHMKYLKKHEGIFNSHWSEDEEGNDDVNLFSHWKDDLEDEPVKKKGKRKKAKDPDENINVFTHLKDDENISEGSKYSDDDITQFFQMYADDGKLKIEDGFVNKKHFSKDLGTITDNSKKAKLITIDIVDSRDGIYANGEETFTDFESLSKALSEIRRFYSLSGEDINYYINTKYGLEIGFIVIGDSVNSELGDKFKIDEMMSKLRDILIKRNYKVKYGNNNFLDIRTKNRQSHDGALYALRNLENGHPHRTSQEMTDVFKEIHDNGYKANIQSYDKQIVVKLVKSK